MQIVGFESRKMDFVGTGLASLSCRSLGGITDTNSIASEGVKMCEQKTCKKCGGVEFYKNGQCKPCQNAHNAAWRARNPEKAKAAAGAWDKRNPEMATARRAAWHAKNRKKVASRKAAYYAKNAETVQARNQEWRDKNPDMVKAHTMAWRKANPEKVRIYSNNRRTREKEAEGSLSPGLGKKLYALQRGKCACCRSALGDDYHLDHVIPLALDGPNEDWNMQLLCPTCNRSKGAKHPVEFMRRRGFLL